MRHCIVTAVFLLVASSAGAATHRAKPGDDLQAVVNRMQKGDELLLANGVYQNACIDLKAKNGLTIRAENVVTVKIVLEQGEPIARGGGVILRGQGKPFVFAGGTNITLRGVVIDSCSNTLQSGAIKCGSGWVVEDVVVQNTDTQAVQIEGYENRRASNVILKRVVAQDNGYHGIGGGFADHVRLSDCASFRNNRGWPRNTFGEQGFEKNGKWYCRVQWEGGGGKFALCDDVVVERHWAQGNNGPGLWFDYQNSNIVVRDSMFIDQTWVEYDYDALGLQLEINPGPTLIENCLFQGNVGGLVVAEDHKATVRKCHFTDGLWARNMAEGAGYRNGGVQDLTVSDNTFYAGAKVTLWQNMDEKYLKENRITVGQNKLGATPPVTWRVDGLPTPGFSGGMPAPIRIFDKVEFGIGVSNGWGPVEVDTSVGEKSPRDGGPLRIAKRTFARGLGVHAPFTATYLLNGERGTFHAKAGIDDECHGRGHATFRVLLDDRPALDLDLRGGQNAKDVAVDVTGKKKLTILVTDAGDGIECDHVDIVEPLISAD